MLVGIWLSFCLRQDLSKPAGSARTPKHPLDFQQAPWHFPSSAASRTSTVDLQLGTCLKSSLRLCQGEGAKHHEPLQCREMFPVLLLWMVKMPGRPFQILQGRTILLLPFLLFSSFHPLPTFFLFHFYLHCVGRTTVENPSACCNDGCSAWLNLKQLFTFLAICWTLIMFPVFLCLRPSSLTTVSEHEGCWVASILPLFERKIPGDYVTSVLLNLPDAELY